jgi:hypothetical protein
MRLISTSKVGTDPFSQLLGSEQAIVLNDVAFAIHPFRLNPIELGTLKRQQERQDAHAFAALLDLLIVLTNPGANRLTLVPGGVIPDQEPVGLASFRQAVTAPHQELRGDGAHGSPRHTKRSHICSCLGCSGVPSCHKTP